MKKIIVVMFILISFLLAGCGNSNKNNISKKETADIINNTTPIHIYKKEIYIKKEYVDGKPVKILEKKISIQPVAIDKGKFLGEKDGRKYYLIYMNNIPYIFVDDGSLKKPYFINEIKKKGLIQPICQLKLPWARYKPAINLPIKNIIITDNNVVILCYKKIDGYLMGYIYNIDKTKDIDKNPFKLDGIIEVVTNLRLKGETYYERDIFGGHTVYVNNKEIEIKVKENYKGKIAIFMYVYDYSGINKDKYDKYLDEKYAFYKGKDGKWHKVSCRGLSENECYVFDDYLIIKTDNIYKYTLY